MPYTSTLDFGPYGNYGTIDLPAAKPQGGGFMPIAAVAIPAAASLAGSLIASRSAGKASQAQERAASDALAFQREQAAARRASYDQAMDAYKQQWLAWQQRRDALLGRYGIDVGSAPAGGPMAGGMAPAGGGAAMGPAMAPPAARMAAAPLGAMMAGGGKDLGSWSDWNRYGLAR